MALSRFSYDNDQDFFDNMMQRSFAPFFAGLSQAAQNGRSADGGSRFYPKFDVIQKDDKCTVMAELPGLAKDKVDITLEDDRLTISGSTQEEKEYTDEAKVTHKERSFGSFTRTLQVPAGLKPEDIKASMDHGILKVELPTKSKEVAPKKITIG